MSELRPRLASHVELACAPAGDDVVRLADVAARLVAVGPSRVLRGHVFVRGASR